MGAEDRIEPWKPQAWRGGHLVDPEKISDSAKLMVMTIKKREKSQLKSAADSG